MLNTGAFERKILANRREITPNLPQIFPKTKVRKTKYPRKVMKKAVFFRKTAFLVVAGEGLEPTTSGL